MASGGQHEPGTGALGDCGTFLLDVMGTFPRDALEVRWSAKPFAPPPEVAEIIEQTWQRERERAERDRGMLFDGPLCRLIAWRTAGRLPRRRLILSLAPVGYREFIGTNATHAHLRYTHGVEALANALGVSAAVATSDGFLVLGRRSRLVAQYAGRIHPVGGSVEPRHKGPPDPFAALTAEVHEELGLAAGEQDALCLGIVRDKHTAQPEMIFDLAVAQDLAEVQRASEKAKDAAEHEELVPVRDHPAVLVSFLERSFAELTPIALAALLLHGQRRWGSGWFAAARGFLRSVV